jgi:hypothetical protein
MEKAELARMQSIESFPKEKLRHSATIEKVVLPDAQGLLCFV